MHSKFLRVVCRSNLILADCVEERWIQSKDYNESEHENQTKRASRRLQQAMVPGQHLVKVQVDRSVYQARVVDGGA
jgi:hypothetical protein